MARIYVRGNTYPIKDQLSSLGLTYDRNERAWWTEDSKVAEQALALLSPAPIYNSPPPQDLGTVDPAAAAAKFGRVAVAGAEIESRTEYGLVKIDNGEPDGTIRQIRRTKGAPLVRILQIARTSRRYLSRDFLDDCDIFGASSGGSYQWDGVEVEPTDAEKEADRVAAELVEKAKRTQEEKRAAAQAEADAIVAARKAATAGLVETTVGPAKWGYSKVVAGDAQQIEFGEGELGWILRINMTDDYRDYYYLEAAAAKAAYFAWAEKCGITPESAKLWLEKYSGCYGADLYRAITDATPSEAAALYAAAKRVADERADEQKRQEASGAYRRTFEANIAAAIGLPATAIKATGYKPLAWAYLNVPTEAIVTGTQEQIDALPGSVTLNATEPVEVKITGELATPPKAKRKTSRGRRW